MNNADMPAAPVPENLEGYYEDPKTCKRFMPFMGTTKREEFAKAAMQGLLAFYGDGQEWSVTAGEAVACADALLAELEQSQ